MGVAASANWGACVHDYRTCGAKKYRIGKDDRSVLRHWPVCVRKPSTCVSVRPRGFERRRDAGSPTKSVRPDRVLPSEHQECQGNGR